jgi:hypothetical protein
MSGHLWETWAPNPSGAAPEVRSLLRAVMGLHSTFSDEIWLWRGQADANHNLEPGMHTRVRGTTGVAFEEANVLWATAHLLANARDNRLDLVEDLRLPDLALLAHLQHHGAATPLLDVSVDPLVALWMVVHASRSDVTALDDRAGVLFAIRKPPRTQWISALDSRSYWQGEGRDRRDRGVGDAYNGAVHWYRAPDISERLRIQRGSFLAGPLDDRGSVTLPLDARPGTNWLERRIERLGKPGQPVKPQTDIAAFGIRGGLKGELRRWLEDRAGLTQEVIYPTPWHRPFLEDFCRAYGRDRPLDVP